ncbi:MAG TPA: hypothetical protein DDW23_07330 [Planctomycetes bacterium]|nr:hypothetical protein [Planctomycetota bacterium]
MAGFLLLAAPLLSPQLDMQEGPLRGQLYSRGLATNGTSVPISGAVTAPNCTRIYLIVTRDGLPWSTDMNDLHYSGGNAQFAFSTWIEAGLYDYAFELRLEANGQTQRASFVGDVVCGDAFLINGQSNAVAGDYHQEGRGNADQSRWVRSYGSAGTSASAVTADDRWHVADGIEFHGSGTVGSWGLRAARLISDQYQIPIALFNGAVGGTYVSQHARDDGNPENLLTIYGRLLYRARKAGLDQTVRGLLWHQGESDGQTPPSQYLAAWGDLRDDWIRDYPSLEQVFMFQVRRGCGISNMKIRELQRTCGDVFANVTVLPTAGVDEHDGCHFRYAGYREMGTWMAAAMAKVLYGEMISPSKNPPNLKEARFTSTARDEIELLFRGPNQLLVLDAGIESHMTLGVGVPETIVSAAASPGKITLQLSGSTLATEVIYRGHIGTGPWIRNTAGVGAFTFRVPILP